MLVSFTSQISMQWNDNRILFTNLRNATKHLISDSTEKKIWNPFDYVAKEEALIGEVHIDKQELYIDKSREDQGRRWARGYYKS